MMRKLELLFRECDIPFDAKNNQINCFPHIINIIAQHILKKVSKSVAADADDTFVFEQSCNPEERHTPPKTFEEACASNPLG